MSILDGIHDPSDLKLLSIEQSYVLAAEIRRLIVDTVSVNGGHLASNLGVVELTIAMHRVFSTPRDGFVWDVGHQCYAHKILTGRRDVFSGIRMPGGLSGFPKRSESPHDAFDTGHASTSISAALGLLAANRALGKDDAVVAVIGDGALTGGMAYEAMSHAGQLGLPLLIVLNDNSMSISPNVGAVSRYLSRLTTTVPYQDFRRMADKAMLMIPLVGRKIHDSVLRAKKSIKAFFFKESLFADLGFEYAGPIDGHNIAVLCDVLAQARAIRKPVVIHVVTKKGKGHPMAEEDPASWHGVAPAACNPTDPDDPSAAAADPSISFTQAFGASMLCAAENDPRVVAVTAAMAKGTGLSAFQATFPERLYDVGIAEEHAVTFAAGMAAGGLRPVVAIYSTFMQRAVDQVIHDVALDRLPVVFALDRAGAVPDDGETHQGIYDIQVFRGIAGLSILAPASAAELDLSLRWALGHDGPSMIRYPKAPCPAERPAYLQALEFGRGAFVRKGKGGAGFVLIGSGALTEECLSAADFLAERGLDVDVYNLRFLRPVDPEAFLADIGHYRYALIAEEGILEGSVAVDLASLAERQGIRAVAKGFRELPGSQAGRAELLERAGLSAKGLAAAALELARETGSGRAERA